MHKVSILIQKLIGLCYMVIIFFIRRHIDYFVCNPGILRIRFIHLSVWCLYKSIFIDTGIGAREIDQTDVRTFRRLNGHILP